MRIAGGYLIFVAVILRAAVVLSGEPEFLAAMALLAAYGLLLFGKIWLVRRKPPRFLQSPQSQLAYLGLQAVLVLGIMIIATYEDFLALLFIPLSLDVVSFLGRRDGFISIALFSGAMLCTFLFSDEGPLFGLAMGAMYSGLCFLFGGYAHQVQKAEAAHDQNKRMLNELQRAHRQLQDFADQVANLAVEHERNHLARDLHDSVTQTVFSMNLVAQSARLLLDKEPARAAGQLVRLEELAASAQREIQSLVSQLSPLSVAEVGLPAALHRLAAEQKARNGLRVSLEVCGERLVSETIATALYSIAYEALTNVARHSGLCEAVIRLGLDKDHSFLEIEDHGSGFDPELKIDQRGHFGLAGMSERAHEIGWSLSVESRRGHGTRIRAMENPSGDSE